MRPASPLTTILPRLSFLNITDETRLRLRELWPVIEPKLPELLDAFYKHLVQNQDARLEAALGDKIPALKAAQTAYWGRLFSGRFDELYFTTAQHVGKVHYRVGLEPKWYMGGYAFILDHLAQLMLTTYAGEPDKQATAISALTKAVMLDMEIATSVYCGEILEFAPIK